MSQQMFCPYELIFFLTITGAARGSQNIQMFLPPFGRSYISGPRTQCTATHGGVTSVQSPGKIFCSYIGYLKQTPALRRVKVSVLMRLILNDSQISDQSAPHDRPQSRALSCPTHCSQLTPLKSGGQLDLGEWEGYVAIARQVTT